jgi:glycolate oxidase FAD binding subunit
MAVVDRPASTEDVRAAVAEAMAAGRPLAPRGHGSKAGLGHPVEHSVLDLSGLSGVTLYEPEELVLSAGAGTPLDEIVQLLDQRGQELAFEPPETSLLWGEEGAGTLGGLMMSALSGPRRIKAGAVRDHVLGVTAVSGRGEIFKAGGRVVKNVTGYDLARALTGSFGTLAVLTEITLKVLPKAETEASLVLAGLDPVRAVEALCLAMGAPVDVSGAAHLPLGSTAGVPDGATVIRLEGVHPSVESRFDLLAGLLRPFGAAEKLPEHGSRRLWRAVRDLEPVAAAPFDVIWRVSVQPTAGPRVAASSGATPLLYDWSGGLVWLGTEADRSVDAARTIRAAVEADGGGHATLMRGPDALRRRVPVFHPQPAPLAALSRRLKAAFDPAGILNPGRMGEGL